MTISKPNVSLSIIPAQVLSTVREQRVLVVGQMLTGTAVAGDLLQEVPNNESEINALFGAKSHLAYMIREFKKLNKLTQLDVIPLEDNGSAVQATSTIQFAGTATAAGTIYVSAVSDKNYRAEVDIAIGDTAAEVATKVQAAVAALATNAPFAASVSTDTVTFTASNGGTIANTWYVGVDGTVAGITQTITAWASGATDPVLTDVLDPIDAIRYQTVIWPEAYEVTTITDILDARFNVNNDVLDGVAIQTINGTLASLKTAVSSLNSQSLVAIGDKTLNRDDRKGGALREMPDAVSSQVAAMRALRFTPDAELSQYLTTTAARDQFGGLQLATLPYFNTAMVNLPIMKAVDQFTKEEQAELNSNGVSLVGSNRAFNGMILGELVTTYLTDEAGNADTSFKFLNTVDTMSVVREVFFENYKKRYAQTRLTNGSLVKGRDMANVESIKAFSLEVYKSLADDALLQAGANAEKDFLNNIIVELELASGTANIDMRPLLVSQLRAIFGTIQVNFGG